MIRVATHSLYLPDGGYLHRMVVELEQGLVTAIYPLDGELENTSWLPGVIVLPPAPEAEWTFRSPEAFMGSENARFQSQQPLYHLLLQRALGRRAAYCPNFDFSRWQAADEIPHIQWL